MIWGAIGNIENPPGPEGRSTHPGAAPRARGGRRRPDRRLPRQRRRAARGGAGAARLRLRRAGIGGWEGGCWRPPDFGLHDFLTLGGHHTYGLFQKGESK